MSSNLVKRCPACGTENSASLLGCFHCGESIIHIGYVDKVAEKQKNLDFERHWLLEEILTPTFWVCAPVSFFSAILALVFMGGILTPLFLFVAILFGGVPFLAGDPVGKFISRRLEENSQPDHKKPKS